MATNKGVKWTDGVGPRFKMDADSKRVENETNKVNEKLGLDVKEKCSLCGKMFKKRPFERNAICWVMQHTETPTYEKPSWICPECKKQLNLFMTKVLMDKKHWKVVGEDEWNEW